MRKFLAFALALTLCTPVFFSLPGSVYATTCGFGSDIGGGQCRGYLTTTGSGTWTVPNDWSSTNTIEVIGGGGGAKGGLGSGSTPQNAAGGGGGAYAKISNISLTGGSSISIQVGSGGSGGTPG